MTEIKTKAPFHCTQDGLLYPLCGSDVGHNNCNLTTEQLRAMEEGSTVRINGNTYVLTKKFEGTCICGHATVNIYVRPF